MTLNADMKLMIQTVLRGSNPFGGGGVHDVDFNAEVNLANGTGANQGDLIYWNARTVGDGSNDDIDLAGSLTDPLGQTLTFAEIVAIALWNKPLTGANTTNLTIGAGSNPFNGFLGGTTPTLGPFGPGALCFLADPSAAGLGTVTGGTGDILRIANSAGAANTYQLMLIGRSA